ncbi:MAG: hypothetical protein KIT33_01250 [Candidatus Kapabacteria bacterium]|nr:hypothetical protein [Ignavibacteriota bacterium]MCW5883575.1 hypothetical protein [Candidatus Kapabacteria bacterium]
MKKIILLISLLLMISCSEENDERLLKAKANLNKGAYESARLNLEKVIKNDSTNYEAFVLMGRLEFAMDNLKESLVYYDIALEINPDYVAAYKERAKSYRMLGLLDKSINDLSSIINIYHDDGFIFLERANVFFEKGDMDSACRDWTKANELGIGEAKRIYQKFCQEMEIQ